MVDSINGAWRAAVRGVEASQREEEEGAYRFAQRITAVGASAWPDCASQVAPLSPIVLAAWLAEPSFDMQVALTITSSTAHMASFAIPFSEVDRTTRNWGGGDTPSLPAGPCGP